MPKDQTEQVRDDNLRLLLSAQESGFIHSRLNEARSGIRQNLIASGCGFLYIAAIPLLAIIGLLEKIPSVLLVLGGFAALVAAIAVVYGLICALGAWLSLLRYRSYDDDHYKFLKHYRRNQPT